VSKSSRRAVVLAAVVFGLLAAESRARIVDQGCTSWRLRPPTWAASDLREGPYRVEEVQADALGGFVRVTFIGTGSCQGQVQRFRYSWRFDRDVSGFSGAAGAPAMTVTLFIEGDENQCLNMNPYFTAQPYGDLLAHNVRGEARYCWKPNEMCAQGPRSFTIYQANRTEEGFRIGIWLPCPGGCGVHVDYIYDGSTGSTGEPGDTCAQYARRAVEQNQENARRGCGFSGARWHDDYDAHRGWCSTVDRATADGETAVRDQELARCGGGDNRSRCEGYARRAVEQNQENQRRACGYSGPRWGNDYDGHFSWCMGVEAEASDQETRARDEELGRCDTQGTLEFRNPTVNGYRVDRCLTWGQQCDKPAADKFCLMNGYAEAESWQWEYVRPTYILGAGQLCDFDYCGGFSSVVCRGMLRK